MNKKTKALAIAEKILKLHNKHARATHNKLNSFIGDGLCSDETFNMFVATDAYTIKIDGRINRKPIILFKITDRTDKKQTIESFNIFEISNIKAKYLDIIYQLVKRNLLK